MTSAFVETRTDTIGQIAKLDTIGFTHAFVTNFPTPSCEGLPVARRFRPTAAATLATTLGSNTWQQQARQQRPDHHTGLFRTRPSGPRGSNTLTFGLADCIRNRRQPIRSFSNNSLLNHPHRFGAACRDYKFLHLSGLASGPTTFPCARHYSSAPSIQALSSSFQFWFPTSPN